MDSHRPPRLSLDLLRGFRAAALHLSFTRAARELCVTQSAVSREVRTLEDQLGTPLFLRVGRALQLTPAGQELYRCVDQALALIDAAALRVTGSARTLAVTATVPFASMWLVPRLARFTRLHPDINMRVAASNDVLDLEREHLDVAIRYVPLGAQAPAGEKLLDYEVFPVCVPKLAANPAQPLRCAADLAHHVLLDLETLSNSRPWLDWPHWLDAMAIRSLKPAGLLRFSHYDQVIEAALNGSGVAIGKRPHLARQLRSGELVAPLGKDCVARLGAFHLVVAGSADRDAVAAFVAWLHREAQSDAAPLPGEAAGSTPCDREALR